MEKERRAVVGDANLEDGLGLAGDERPEAEAVEHALRALGDSGGAPVEGLVEHGRGVFAIDHRHGGAGAGASNREGEAGETAAHDDELDARLGHGGYRRRWRQRSMAPTISRTPNQE